MHSCYCPFIGDVIPKQTVHSMSTWPKCHAITSSPNARMARLTATSLRSAITTRLAVYSADKKTDLIGEAHVDLSSVIVPGGGTNDVWQGLTCKGKYAGEVRLELTYYDARPKPERASRASNPAAIAEDGTVVQKQKVKRRPLPGAAPLGPTADSIESFPTPTSRVRNGPRELSAPSRATSLPPDALPQQPGFNGSPGQFNTPPPNNYAQEHYEQFENPWRRSGLVKSSTANGLSKPALRNSGHTILVFAHPSCQHGSSWLPCPNVRRSMGSACP